jgi:hypothetical protein
MWNAVQDGLSEILSSRVFPFLAQDPGYVRIFRNAGLPGKIPTDVASLPPVVKQRLSDSSRMCAQLLTMHVEGRNALRERRAKAVVLEGPETIYRMWSQKDSTSRIGPWWFTEGVLQLALKEAKGDRTAALGWLRDRMAVSLDWSDCDKVAQIVLHPGNALPAIEALGLPMPVYSKNAPGAPGVSMPTYWASLGTMLQGQKTQYFLPFIPVERVRDFW